MAVQPPAPLAAPSAATADAVLQAFDQQAQWCGSAAPFSARVLQRSRLWLQTHDAALAELQRLSADPLAAAVPLRWLAALHLLALQGIPPYARLWPDGAPGAEPARGDQAPAGRVGPAAARAPGLAHGGPFGAAPDGSPDAALDAAIEHAWHSHRTPMQMLLRLPPQTNEVQRSAALLPGLLHVAAQTELPLVLLELGASAGLNLWCDHYRHDHGIWSWAEAAPSLVLRSDWVGPPPPWQAQLHIVRRAGCDANPVDLDDSRQTLRLAAYIWAEQGERLHRLQQALPVAAACMARSGVRIQAAGAADFLRLQLRQRRPGQATVVMHSVVWQYIAPAQQADIEAQLLAAGRQADANSPLAWLRFEPSGPDLAVELRCRLWPLGDDRLLARCHPHAARIEWLG